jgi:transposase InsO family protein
MKAITDSLGVSRSNLYEKREEGRALRRGRYRKDEDDALLPLIREIVDVRSTYGYPRTTALLNKKLAVLGRPRVNEKRVYRIMAMNNLLLQKHTGRPTRTHDGEIITLKSNTRWCSDVFAIICWNAEIVWVAFSLDCCDREVMSYIATTAGISGEMIRDLMAETIESRFGLVDRLPHRIEWLTDNGSAYTAHDTRNFALSMGLAVCTTPVQSPESNGMAEGFVKTFKRDYVHVNRLDSARVVLEQLPGWFEDYNEIAPHKGLKMKSPREYRKSLAASVGCPV